VSCYFAGFYTFTMLYQLRELSWHYCFRAGKSVGWVYGLLCWTHALV